MFLCETKLFVVELRHVASKLGLIVVHVLIVMFWVGVVEVD